MRIVLLTAHISSLSAGVWNAIAELASALSAAGVAITVVGLADCREGNVALIPSVPVTRCRVLGPDAFGFAPALTGAIAASQPDLVHIQGLWMYPSLASLRWHGRTGRPHIIAPQGMLDPWALQNASWKKRIAGWLYENAHLHHAACLHALNQHEARAMRDYGLRNPIAVVPNGVNLPADVVRAAPGWRKGLPLGARVLLFLGRFHPKKGLAELIEAWSLVRHEVEGEGWHLVIAGWDDGSHLSLLRARVKALGLERSAIFVGPQFGAEKEATFAHADAFVLPSLSEGLPIAVLEAWSHSLPVLMTPACNLPEGFAAGAAIPTHSDPASIAAGLRTMLEMSNAERKSMGAGGRRLVEERFIWPGIAETMKAVYAWSQGGGLPPPCVITD
jgi:glycosyltransferase involved in cell wall biosynthesis